jgi:uncharacterized protein
MPPKVLSKVQAYFDAAGPLLGRTWPIRYRGDEAELLRQLRTFGVRTFTALLYPHKPGMAAWLNEWAVDFAARTPDALHTATFFAEPGAATYVRDAIDRGARVVKAHLQVGGYDPGDPLLDAVWAMLAENRTPVVVHCGSGPVPGRYTGPEPIAAVLARHPHLVLIVAHSGCPEYGDFLDLAARFDGVHLDTTMTFTDFMESIAPFPMSRRPMLRDLGNKVLLGTDFPNIPHPYAHQLEALARLDLGDDWLRAVCWGNSRTLFSLP